MFLLTFILFGTNERDWHILLPDMVFLFWCYVFNCLVQEELNVLAHECPTRLNWYCNKGVAWLHVTCATFGHI
jgi:hypothetical protein